MGHDNETIYNPLKQRPFGDIVTARYSRRDLLRTGGKLGALAAFAGLLKPSKAIAGMLASTSALSFAEIAKSNAKTHAVAPGYGVDVLMRWGDRILPDAPKFDPLAQSARAQLGQFGYNNDFLAYIPFPDCAEPSSHGFLCSNHEYTTTYLMFPNISSADAKYKITRAQAEIEMAAHGHGTIEIKQVNGKWEPVIGSPYNRRMNPLETPIAIAGPAAGHARMQTSGDPDGRTVIGTLGNCAGGVTPWQSVLVAEENFNGYFGGNPESGAEAANHARYGIQGSPWYGWHRFFDRFNVEKEPNEANRFGWVVEYDPADPDRQPIKRTALGRFKHETATATLAPDGRVVIYSGDDERFEYLYRFVSAGKYDAVNRKANFGLLDEGTLSAARFHEDGSMEWLPLVFGEGKLTPENGFSSQGEVLIETRRAADLLGATPMDRPEGIAVQPQTGQVFVAMTNNNKRKEANVANHRANNIHGHIVELLPPEKDHAASRFQWKIFLQGGNPANPEEGALYGGSVSEHGWLSCPDNLTMDPSGRMWIATDGQDQSIGKNDGLYATQVSGEASASPRLFFTGPVGCEITGPAFTPDGSTLFLAIQHPGDGGDFANPATRWPDFKDGMPPRPSVIAITKKDGGIIGG